jgi:hypothetical protein
MRRTVLQPSSLTGENAGSQPAQHEEDAEGKLTDSQFKRGTVRETGMRCAGSGVPTAAGPYRQYGAAPGNHRGRDGPSAPRPRGALVSGPARDEVNYCCAGELPARLWAAPWGGGLIAQPPGGDETTHAGAPNTPQEKTS